VPAELREENLIPSFTASLAIQGGLVRSRLPHLHPRVLDVLRRAPALGEKDGEGRVFQLGRETLKARTEDVHRSFGELARLVGWACPCRSLNVFMWKKARRMKADGKGPLVNIRRCIFLRVRNRQRSLIISGPEHCMCFPMFFCELRPLTLLQQSHKSCSNTQLNHSQGDVNITYMYRTSFRAECGPV
jgi:hypothetical protein